MLRLFAFATFASLASADITISEVAEVVDGCTNPNAINFDTAANRNNGECRFDASNKLFISEVAEGSSNNKYFEIYNPTTETVSLDSYAFPMSNNAAYGKYEHWNIFTEGKYIAAGDVYVVCHGSSDEFILAACNETYNYLSNGDDGLCLAQGTEDSYTLLDCVGDFNGDPGSGWEVAGVPGATKDHTLVRKISVTQGNGNDWAKSNGTDENNSEWIVADQNYWSNLGFHTYTPPDPVLGCMLADMANYNGLANTDDGSCRVGYCPDSSFLEYDATFMSVIKNECISSSCEGDCEIGSTCSRGEIQYTQSNSCATEVVYGCMLTGMANYNGLANTDDGSCHINACLDSNYLEYEFALFVECSGVELDSVYQCITMDWSTGIRWASGVNYTVTPSCASEVVYGCTNPNATHFDTAANRNNGECRFDASNKLFISEVAEGSSNNKYFEIYNPTTETVSLDSYAFPMSNNAAYGKYEHWNIFTEGKYIAAGDVYVVCHGSSDEFILAACNETYNYLSNGDDGLCLAQGTEDSYTLLDCVGDFNGDPGSGWEVAGVPGATKDHTLVRKISVTQGNGNDWATSAGTDANNSEWIVADIDNWNNLGTYGYTLGCRNADATNYNINATIDDGTCIGTNSCDTNGGDCTIVAVGQGKPDIHAVYKSWNGPFGVGDPTFTTDFYTGSGICCYDNDDGTVGGGYNREHIWPQSRWPDGKGGVHSLFNLMPTEASANSRRSNKLFGGSSVLGYTPYNGQTKGIVARVILNLAYRFADCSQADGTCFNSMMNYLTIDDADANKMGDYNVLAQWALDNQQDQQEQLHYNSMLGENTVSLTVWDKANTFADSTVLQSFRTYLCVTYGGTACTRVSDDTVLTITTTVCDAATSVAMTGPWFGWDPNFGPVASDNGDGSWTFTFDPAPRDNMEYLLVVDGVQEDLVASNTASEDWSCTPLTDYWSYTSRQWVVGSGDVSNTYGTCGSCEVESTTVNCAELQTLYSSNCGCG